MIDGIQNLFKIPELKRRILYTIGLLAVLRGMGLTKMHKAVTLLDTPQIRGMIEKVKHLVRVEPSSG